MEYQRPFEDEKLGEKLSYTDKVYKGTRNIEDALDQLAWVQKQLQNVLGMSPAVEEIFDCIVIIRNNSKMVKEGFNEISNEYTKTVFQHSGSMLTLALGLTRPKEEKPTTAPGE